MNTVKVSRALRYDGMPYLLRLAAGPEFHEDKSALWIHPLGGGELEPDEERIRKLVIAVDQACTSDAATVNVAAEVFWGRARADDNDPEDPTAPRELDRIAHASLAETIGSCTIGALLLERYALEQRLYLDIRSKALDWGLVVCAVAIREVRIPTSSQFDNETQLLIALKQLVIQHRSDRELDAKRSSLLPADGAP